MKSRQSIYFLEEDESNLQQIMDYQSSKENISLIGVSSSFEMTLPLLESGFDNISYFVVSDFYREQFEEYNKSREKPFFYVQLSSSEKLDSSIDNNFIIQVIDKNIFYNDILSSLNSLEFSNRTTLDYPY